MENINAEVSKDNKEKKGCQEYITINNYSCCKHNEESFIEKLKNMEEYLENIKNDIIYAFNPAGTIVYYAAIEPPKGYLKCNGMPISRKIYADLFAVIGETYGAGDGLNTFNLPDLRGEFIRVFDEGRGVDEGREFASSQADAFKNHNHELKVGAIGVTHKPDGTTQTARLNNPATSEYILDRGDNETRPRNIALLACIKF